MFQCRKNQTFQKDTIFSVNLEVQILRAVISFGNHKGNEMVSFTKTRSLNKESEDPMKALTTATQYQNIGSDEDPDPQPLNTT